MTIRSVELKDQLQRLIFSDLDLRGQIVYLNQAYRDAIEGHAYSDFLRRLIGEALAAAALLGTNLKDAGTVSIQAQGDGYISLLMAECREQRYLRATVQTRAAAEPDNFRQALGQGVLAINIEPHRGQRYQGLVPLEQGSLSACLEDYFWQSEQLQTQMLLAADGEIATGLMIQALPLRNPRDVYDDEDWNRISQLTATLSGTEMLASAADEILYKLYHDEVVQLFEPNELSYACSCSRDRYLTTLGAMDQAEVATLFNEDRVIITQCHFCNTQYILTEAELAIATRELLLGNDRSALH